MLTSFIAGYLINGEKPTSSAMVSAAILTIGAMIAAVFYEKSQEAVAGLLLVWVGNFA